RPLLAVLTAAMLVAGPSSPLFAQEPPQNPTPQTTQEKTGTFSLGSSKRDFSHAPKPFPNLIAPYRPISIGPSEIVNSPRLDQMIHDNKLELSLQDTVELALENNMDIAVQRYYPWLADAQLLRAKAGGFGGGGGGLPGAAFIASTANSPLPTFDPQLTTTLLFDNRTFPVNNPLTSGTGTGISTLASLATHTAQYNTQYTQGFASGTTFFTT